jgi:cobalamin biosynthetic protein CobC
MAKSASATDMISTDGADEPLVHGGDLGAARRRFPGAREPFIDLSTGINPNSYPLPRFSADIFVRLPEPDLLADLAHAAARAYGAPSAECVVVAPGTQILMALAAALVPPGRAAVWTPGYAEQARAAALAGHAVSKVSNLTSCGAARLVVVTNPNNPDGHWHDRAALLTLAAELRRHGGLLLVDEAFIDVGPPDASVGGEVSSGNVVVLRSFGKFFGLPGLRLGFAVAAPPLAARLRAMLGPWPVSGPALAGGAKALADHQWIAQARLRLARAAQRIDRLLADADLDVVGGTNLYRLVQSPMADGLFRQLGQAGIWVRLFSDHPNWLRFGLPADRIAWQRLGEALRQCRAGASPQANEPGKP